jgi:PhzF family phenazine biosynthesis protein
MTAILSYAAFTETPEGGNPAGVVLDASALSDTEMLKIAADLGYSETAFVVARDTPNEYDVRYFAPEAEVPFCGHATIATGVALAERDGAGTLVFHTKAGSVPVFTEGETGGITATLTSVEPHTEDVPEDVLDNALDALGWDKRELDETLPPKIAYAGARHLILAAATRERLADLDYDFDRLGALMATRDWTTVQLVWREEPGRFHSRNPFPPGGVVEDPATGAAAAAFGAYLRELGLIEPPATVTILQGEDLGRPGRLLVDIHANRPEIDVTGAAVPI